MAFEIVDRIGTWRLSGSDGMVYGAKRPDRYSSRESFQTGCSSAFSDLYTWVYPLVNLRHARD